MIRCDFVFGEDSEFGTDGWIPKANLDFNAMNGMGVAHDTMEHFNLGEGTLEEEFLAFGAMFYIRVEGGYFHNYTRSHLRPVDHLSGDLAKFSIEKFWQGNGLVLNDMPWRPRHLEFWESDLEELLRETMRLIRSEMDEPDYRVFRRINPNFESLLKRWIRRGYSLCAKKYRKANPMHLSDTFAAIEREVDQIKYVEHGDELSITVRVKDGYPKHKIELRRLEDAYQDDY